VSGFAGVCPKIPKNQNNNTHVVRYCKKYAVAAEVTNVFEETVKPIKTKPIELT